MLKKQREKQNFEIGNSNFSVLGQMDLSKGVINHLENCKELRDSLLNVDLKERILKLKK